MDLLLLLSLLLYCKRPDGFVIYYIHMLSLKKFSVSFRQSSDNFIRVFYMLNLVDKSSALTLDNNNDLFIISGVILAPPPTNVNCL